MNRNVGTPDRYIRISLGAVLVALAASGAIGAWGYLGIVPLVTGLVARCPAYRIVAVDTSARRSRRGR